MKDPGRGRPFGADAADLATSTSLGILWVPFPPLSSRDLKTHLGCIVVESVYNDHWLLQVLEPPCADLPSWTLGKRHVTTYLNPQVACQGRTLRAKVLDRFLVTFISNIFSESL